MVSTDTIVASTRLDPKVSGDTIVQSTRRRASGVIPAAN
jgi:hypothetical protein